MAVIVEAVPMVMQCPNERAMPPSIPCHSRPEMLPARRSSQNFHASEPEPGIGRTRRFAAAACASRSGQEARGGGNRSGRFFPWQVRVTVPEGGRPGCHPERVRCRKRSPHPPGPWPGMPEPDRGPPLQATNRPGEDPRPAVASDFLRRPRWT
jgi:hypothetical protein